MGSCEANKSQFSGSNLAAYHSVITGAIALPFTRDTKRLLSTEIDRK